MWDHCRPPVSVSSASTPALVRANRRGPLLRARPYTRLVPMGYCHSVDPSVPFSPRMISWDLAPGTQAADQARGGGWEGGRHVTGCVGGRRLHRAPSITHAHSLPCVVLGDTQRPCEELVG